MILLSAWTALWILASWKLAAPIPVYISNGHTVTWCHSAFLGSKQHSTESDFPSMTTVLGCVAVVLGVGKCFLQWISNAKLLLRANANDFG